MGLHPPPSPPTARELRSSAPPPTSLLPSPSSPALLLQTFSCPYLVLIISRPSSWPLCLQSGPSFPLSAQQAVPRAIFLEAQILWPPSLWRIYWEGSVSSPGQLGAPVATRANLGPVTCHLPGLPMGFVEGDQVDVRHCSKCGLWTSSSGITQGPIRNAESPSPHPDLQNLNLHFLKMPGDSFVP